MYTIDNYDPNVHTAMLSRELVDNLGKRVVAISSVYEQHFGLATGECLETPADSVYAYTTKIENGTI